jgi:uncharacterized membrane protein YfcA
MLQNLSFVFLILALFAEIIGTIGGFGSSVFFVPLANFYFDFESVLGLTAMFHVASNLSKIAQFRKGLNKELILYLGVPAVLFVILGGLLSNVFDSHILEICLGLFLISLSLLFLIRRELVIKQGKSQAIVGGSLSGFLAGLLGTGGAVRGLTMAAFNMEKSVFIATSAAIDFGVDFTRTIVYFFNGFIHTHDLIYVPFLIVVAWIGTYIGKQILSKIPQDRFKRISLFLILLIGIITAINAIWY